MPLATLNPGPEHDGMRLDVFVSSALGPEYTRSQVARMIKAGMVTVNGEPARASAAVRAGHTIEVASPPPAQPGEVLRPAPEIDVL